MKNENECHHHKLKVGLSKTLEQKKKHSTSISSADSSFGFATSGAAGDDAKSFKLLDTGQ